MGGFSADCGRTGDERLQLLNGDGVSSQEQLWRNRKERRRDASLRRRLQRRIKRSEDLAKLDSGARESLLAREKEERIAQHLARVENLEASYERRDPSRCYRICFNCSFGESMSPTELESMVKQISYAYSSLRRNPDIQMQYHITSLDLGQQALRAWKERGTEHWKVHRHVEPYWEVFDPDSVIILTPDAEEELATVDVSKVYVIGGLVDRTVLKNQSYAQASGLKLPTYKLPLKKFGQTLTSSVLNINTVVDILREFIRTNDWKLSFERQIPKRRHGELGPRALRKRAYRANREHLEALESKVLEQLVTLGPVKPEHDDIVLLEMPVSVAPDVMDALRELHSSYSTARKEPLPVLADTGGSTADDSAGDVLPPVPPLTSKGMLKHRDLALWIAYIRAVQKRRQHKREKEMQRQQEMDIVSLDAWIYGAASDRESDDGQGGEECAM